MPSLEMEKNVNSLFISLLEILNREIEVYREIRDVIIREKDILLKPSLEALHESNARKETMILKAKLLEEVRRGIVRRLAAALDLGDGDGEITLAALLEHCPGEKEEALRECRESLRCLFQDIRVRNERNRMLVDSSLLFFRDSIGFINEMISPDAGYLDSGRLKTISRNGKLLSIEG